MTITYTGRNIEKTLFFARELMKARKTHARFTGVRILRSPPKRNRRRRTAISNPAPYTITQYASDMRCASMKRDMVIA
jgi:hypothetical protein